MREAWITGCSAALGPMLSIGWFGTVRQADARSRLLVATSSSKTEPA